jgi:hypothetical protein
MGIREAHDSADAVAPGVGDAAEATPNVPVWATVSIFGVGCNEVVGRALS